MNWIFIYPLWLCPFKLLAQVNCDDVRSLVPGEGGLREEESPENGGVYQEDRIL